jgi:hypothetical protein
MRLYIKAISMGLTAIIISILFMGCNITGNNTKTVGVNSISSKISENKNTSNQNNSDFSKTYINVYYFDSVNGNDKNDGKSEATAWANLKKINNLRLSPGDQLLFKAGSTFNGSIKIYYNGEAKNPIILGMYGTGEKPKINTTSSKYVLDLSDCSWVEASNLDLTNPQGQYGVVMAPTKKGISTHIYLKNLTIHNISGDQTNESAGISFLSEGKMGAQYFDDISIDNCTIKNVGKNGIIFQSDFINKTATDSGNVYFMPSKRISIKHNNLDTISGTGIHVVACDSPIIEYNKLNKMNQVGSINESGISISNCNDAVIQYNEISGTKYSSGGSQAFVVDVNCIDMYAQYNYSHNNEGGFLLMRDNDLLNNSSNKNIIRYNLSVNDYGASATNDSSQNVITFDGHIKNVMIYNNTIYIEKGTQNVISVKNTDSSGFAENIDFENNIFYNKSDGIYDINNGVKFKFEANIFYGKNSSTQPKGNNFVVDPMLVSPGAAENSMAANKAYQLLPKSPAIGAGVVIPYNGGTDFNGRQLPDKPNIGAFE